MLNAIVDVAPTQSPVLFAIATFASFGGVCVCVCVVSVSFAGVWYVVLLCFERRKRRK
jgi:hypothetical protein